MSNPLDGSIPIEPDPRDPHAAEATEARLRAEAAMDQILPAAMPEEFPALEEMADAAQLELDGESLDQSALPNIIASEPFPLAPMEVEFPNVPPANPGIGQEAAIQQAFPKQPRRTFTPRPQPRRATLEALPPAVQRQARDDARVMNDMAVDAAEEQAAEQAGQAPPNGPQFPPPAGAVPFDGDENPAQLVGRMGDTGNLFTQFGQELLRLLTAQNDSIISLTRQVEQLHNALERSRSC